MNFSQKNEKYFFEKVYFYKPIKIGVKFMEIYKELKLYSRYKSAFMFCSILSGVLTFLTMMLLILFIYKTNNTILYISIVIIGLNLLSIIFSLLNLKQV